MSHRYLRDALLGGTFGYHFVGGPFIVVKHEEGWEVSLPTVKGKDSNEPWLGASWLRAYLVVQGVGSIWESWSWGPKSFLQAVDAPPYSHRRYSTAEATVEAIQDWLRREDALRRLGAK